MKTLIVSQILFGVAFAGTALAQDGGVDVPQVSSTPNPQVQSSNAPASQQRNPGDSANYQQNVLSNPTISDIARVNALTNGGGNTSAIIQDGSPAASQDTSDHTTQNPDQH